MSEIAKITENIAQVLENVQNDTVGSDLKTLLGQYFSLLDNNTWKILVYNLDYQYNKENLKWNMLNRIDQNKIQILQNVAKEINCKIYLALVEIITSKEIYNYEDFGPQVEELKILDPEIFKNYMRTKLEYITDTAGNHIYANERSELNEDEVDLIKGIDNLKPYKQVILDVDKPMGQSEQNHSMDMSQSEKPMGSLKSFYKFSAVILCARSIGINNLTEKFSNCIEIFLSLSEEPGNQDAVLELVNENSEILIQQFKKFRSKECIKDFFMISLYVQNEEAAFSLLKNMNVSEILSFENVELIPKLENLYGAEWLLNLINECSQKKFYFDSSICDNIITNLFYYRQVSGSNETFIEIVLKIIYNKIKQTNAGPRHFNESSVNDFKNIKSFNQLISFIVTIENTYFLKKIINYLLRHQEFYTINSLANIFFNFRNIASFEYFKNFRELKYTLLERINDQLPQLVFDLDNWSLRQSIGCSCQYCKKIKEFIHSKNETQKSLNINNDGNILSHIFQILRNFSLPLEVTQEKNGLNFELKLIKKYSMQEKKRAQLQKLNEIRNELEITRI